jgi:hypothetical protein
LCWTMGDLQSDRVDIVNMTKHMESTVCPKGRKDPLNYWHDIQQLALEKKYSSAAGIYRGLLKPNRSLISEDTGRLENYLTMG